MGKPLARPTFWENHLPGAYLTFAELMSKRPRLFHVVAPRLLIPPGVRSVASLHTSTRIDDDAIHLHRYSFPSFTRRIGPNSFRWQISQKVPPSGESASPGRRGQSGQAKYHAIQRKTAPVQWPPRGDFPWGGKWQRCNQFHQPSRSHRHPSRRHRRSPRPRKSIYRRRVQKKSERSGRGPLAGITRS